MLIAEENKIIALQKDLLMLKEQGEIALKDNPNDQSAFNYLYEIGIKLQRLALFDEAVSVYETLIQIRPDHTDSHVQLSLSHDSASSIAAPDREYELQKFVNVAHKAASVYIFGILMKVTEQLKIRFIDYNKVWAFNQNSANNEKVSDDSLINASKYYETLHSGIRGKSNVMGICKRMAIPYRGILVVRDPRDIVISLYFSMMYSHPLLTENLEKDRETLMRMNKSEGINWAIDDFENSIASYLCEWLEFLNDEDILILTFEQMLANPFLFFQTIIKHLKLAADQDFLHGLLQEHNFKTISNRKQGEEDVSSHYRKGIVGDWKNHLDESHLRYFLSKPNCSKTLLGFGYESN